MNIELTLYFLPSLDVELLPINGRNLIEYLESREITILLDEIHEFSEGGIYESL